MNRANEVNKAQVNLIKKIAQGGVALPKTSYDLSELVKNALLLRDHDSEEKSSIDKCKAQFIKIVKQKSDDDGWVYISIVKNVLTKRAYYRNLERSQATRSLDAMRSIAGELIKAGAIKKVNNQVMLTSTADYYLNELEGY